MTRGVPAEKLTEVSEAGGPAVSITMTRETGSTRGGVGSVPGAVDGCGRREPQPRIAASQVAAHRGFRDIARVKGVRGET